MQAKWKVFWTVFVLCLAGSIALVYAASQESPPSNSTVFFEVTKTAFLCLGGIGVLLPITLNAMNAFEQRRYEIIENTFKLMGRWDDAHLLAARNYTRRIGKEKSKISDVQLLNAIQSEEALEQSVILVTNYFDNVRFSIKNNRIDTEQFSNMIGSTLVRIIERFWPYYETLPRDAQEDLQELKKLLS